MANTKTVIISCGDKELKFLSVTEAKISEELDSDIIKTFDDPVSVPSSDGGYKVDISALEARDPTEYYDLKVILKRMKTESGNITISETHKHKSGDVLDENYLSGVRLTSNEVTFNAEDLTARELSFNAEGLRELINGQEVE